MEKILGYNTICGSNKLEIVGVDIDFDNGNQHTFHKVKFVDHKDEKGGRIGVMVCAIDDNQYIYMIEQFQVVTESRMLLLPRGGTKNGNYLQSAQEELAEETGYIANELEELTTIYPSPGYFQQGTKLYLARGLSEHMMKGDEVEETIVHKIHISEVVKMIMEGKITDARTVSGIFFVKEYLGL